MSITTNYIKSRFVAATLRETAKRIRAAQDIVVEDYGLFQTGELKKYTRGKFAVNLIGEEGASVLMRYVKYARFLDMKDRRRKLSHTRAGYHLYNRITFGNLYNYTLPTIRDGFTQEIREEWTKNLAQSLGVHEKDLENQIIKQMRHNSLKLSK